MKKVFLKVICILIYLFMLINGHAGALNPGKEAAGNKITRVEELIGERTANSKTYLMSDGSYEASVYAADVHYVSQAGAYEDIDNSIIPYQKSIDNNSYAYKNSANRFTVRFGGQSAYPVRIEYESYSLSLRPSGMRAAEGTLFGDYKYRSAVRGMAAPKSSIVYEEVYPNVDILYEVRDNGFKEFIIIKDETGSNEFYFDIAFDGVEAFEHEGQVYFADSEDETNKVFVVNELFALDAAGAYTDDVKVSYISNGAAPKLRVTVDSAFLTDESREYPIVIDPSVMVTGANNIADSFVRQGSPSTNYKYDEKLFTGNSASNGLQRAYIKFTLPGNIPATSVTSAKVRIKRYGGSPTGIKAYRVTSGWSSGGITWNNKPGYSSSYVSNTAYNDGGEWYAMDVSSTVRNWLNGAYTNYGFALISNYESAPSSSISYYSSDAPSPNKPELIINYTDSGTYYGNRPYVQNNSSEVNCMGYALDINMKIDYDEIGLKVNLVNEKGIDYIEQVVNNKVEEWMRDNMGARGWSTISGYNSDIGLNQYRVVLRSGFADRRAVYVDPETDDQKTREKNDIFEHYSWKDWRESFPEYDESFDYHLWYQTNTGYWAEKNSSLPSRLNSITTPQNESYWWQSPYYMTHRSRYRYYKVDTKGI